MKLASVKLGLLGAVCSALTAFTGAIDTYDVVIIGSGPGGLVAAEFLSRDPSVRVLVLEAGLPSVQATGGDRVPPYAASKGFTQFDIPGEYDNRGSIFNGDNAKYRVDWFEKGEAPYLGKLVGGCSTINAALYFRTPESYVQSANWPFSPQRVNAGFDAIETMFGHTDNPSGDGKRYLQEAYDIVSEAFRTQGRYQEVTINDAPARDNKDKTFGHAPFTIKNGLRDSPAKTFYSAFKNRPNAKLLTSAKASYIRQYQGRATGVVYNDNVEVALSDRGAVIMAAGALSTPKVLIQSGIGPRGQLEQLKNHPKFPGIQQSANGGWVVNENVGQNLFDTNTVFMTFTHPKMVAVVKKQDQPWAQQQYMVDQSGVLATSGPLLIGYENYMVQGRMYEFQTTIIGNGFQGFGTNPKAYMAALYINNPESRDYSAFDKDGYWQPIVRGSVVMSTGRDVAAMKDYSNKVVKMLRNTGSSFISANAGESVDQWVDRNKGWKTNHFMGSCYASSDASDRNRCADDKLRVVGTSNVFVADASVMKEGTVNPYGFIMYAGYEASNVVKEHLANPPVPPTPAKCGDNAIEKNVDYDGPDAGNAPAAQPEGCCTICQANPKCKAFSWTGYNGGTCWLKSSRGNAFYRLGVYSSIVTAEPPTPSCPNLEVGIDYVGNDIGNAPSAKVEGCCAICKARAGCNAFSWNNYNGGTCWLKSGKGETISKAGSISAVVNQVPPTPSCPTPENDVDYTGNDIGNAPSSKPEGCCALCKARAGCNAYSWNNYNGGTCWLKSGKGPTSVKPGTVSGTMTSGCSAIERNIDYAGGDIGSVLASGADKCCDLCRGKSGCQAFTWTDYNGGTCWLKSKKGQSSPKTNAHSGYLL